MNTLSIISFSIFMTCVLACGGISKYNEPSGSTNDSEGNATKTGFVLGNDGIEITGSVDPTDVDDYFEFQTGSLVDVTLTVTPSDKVTAQVTNCGSTLQADNSNPSVSGTVNANDTCYIRAQCNSCGGTTSYTITLSKQ